MRTNDVIIDEAAQSSFADGGLRGDSDRVQQVITRAWEDPAFKSRLMGDPKSVLRECGIPVGGGVQVEVLEEGDQKKYFVLPESPLQSRVFCDQELSRMNRDSLGGQSGHTQPNYTPNACCQG